MANESEIDRILTDLADLSEGDTIDEFQAAALLQAQTILQSLRSQAGVSEAVAWISVCKEGPYQGEVEAQTTEPTKPPFNPQWGDWQPVYARPAPIEITEEAERAFKDGLAYGSNVRNADPDIAWGHSAIRAALQGETK